jgi:hypothetical protein
MKTKITLIAASALLWLSSAKAQAPCANDLNGFVAYKNVAGTGSYQIKNGFEEKASQTYNYSGPGKVSSVRVSGNYPTPGFGGVPLKVGIYNVDASGKPTTPIATANSVWWGYADNGNGYIDVTFLGGVSVNNRFAVTVEIINAFPFGDVFNLKYTGNGEGGQQDLACLAGTSTGNNWASAKNSFGKDGDFYLVPNMAHVNNPSFTTSSSCYSINAPITFSNTTVMSKDSMFNKIAFPNYTGSNTFYSWNFGDGSAVLNSNVLNANHTYTAGGVYTTTLTSRIEGWAGVCTKTFTRSVSVGLNVAATSISSVTCFGNNNGSFVASGQFGAPSYSYALFNGPWQTSPNFSGLLAGNYTLDIKDAKGCTNSTTLTIAQPNGISVSSILVTNASCGNSTGAITSTATGGIAPLQYKLDNGSYQAAGTFTNLLAGTHTLVVKDANACTTTSLVSVNSNAGPVMGTPNITNVSCFNGTDGSITLSSSGGTGLIQYSINGGLTFQTSGVFLNVAAGTYVCSVKDNAGCVNNITVVVTQGPSLGLTVSANPALCFGSSNGQITAASTGGTGTHNYSINGINFQSSPVFTGLPAGNYTVTVKDVTSCTKTGTVVVTQPSVVGITSSFVPVTCYGLSNGAITMNGTGGDGNYSYSIDGISFQGIGTFTNLPAGTYSLTIQDSNGCTNAPSSITITQPAAITATVNTTNSTCLLTNGSIMALAGGGSGSGYQYSINGGTNFFTSGSFSPLASGTYFILIKDGSNCQYVIHGTILSSGGPTITASTQQNVSCNGGNDGSVTISGVVGGTGILQYSKNGVNFQTSSVLTGMQAGVYQIQVKDANGCIAVVTKTITQPNAFLIAPSTSSVTCYGASTGAATIAASGGAGFLVYSINGGNTFQSGTIFNNLTAGSYSLIVKDAANCMGYSSFSISQPSHINLAFGVLNVTCNGANNGAITITAAGGVSPYMYSLNSAAYSTVNSYTNLVGSTNYTIEVKDANNCVVSTTQYIVEPPVLSVTPIVSNISCAGSANGAINLNVTGGVIPYNYQWSTGSVNPSLFNLAAGSYSVVVKDFNGCAVSYSTTLTQPANPLVINGVVTPAGTNSSQDGSVDITVTGGSGPYTFSWSNGATTEDISGVNPGAYMVTITDANGCTTSSTFNVGNITGIASIQISSNEVKIYPNPATEYCTIEANGFKIDKVELYNLLGQKLFEGDVYDSTTKINTSNLVNGTYFVKAYINNTTITKKITINK